MILIVLFHVTFFHLDLWPFPRHIVTEQARIRNDIVKKKVDEHKKLVLYCVQSMRMDGITEEKTHKRRITSSRIINRYRLFGYNNEVFFFWNAHTYKSDTPHYAVMSAFVNIQLRKKRETGNCSSGTQSNRIVDDNQQRRRRLQW